MPAVSPAVSGRSSCSGPVDPSPTRSYSRGWSSGRGDSRSKPPAWPIAAVAVPQSARQLWQGQAGSRWATGGRQPRRRHAFRNSLDLPRAPASCPPVADAPRRRHSRQVPSARTDRYPRSSCRRNPHDRSPARGAEMMRGCSRRGRQGQGWRQSTVVACGKSCIEKPDAKRGKPHFYSRLLTVSRNYLGRACSRSVLAVGDRR